jgi:hypothetical protein
MRAACVVVLLCVFAATGCKGKGEADAAPDPAALKAQQELVARRDALLAARQRLQSDREKVIEEIKQIEAKGGDTSELVKKKSAIENEIEGKGSELIETLSTKLDTIATTSNSSANLAGRESALANREARIAERDRTFAERERNLAERERQLAAREKETCSVAPQVIMQAPPPAHGGNYSRKDVDPLLREARATMQSKGILASDLGPASGLEAESTKAMAEGDWGRAYLAAAQLAQTVKQVKIDRPFVQAKYNRLHTRVLGGKQDEATTKQLTDGMTDVMQKFGDGDFISANRKLNQLSGLVK